jgi:hypothetical protein
MPMEKDPHPSVVEVMNLRLTLIVSSRKCISTSDGGYQGFIADDAARC